MITVSVAVQVTGVNGVVDHMGGCAVSSACHMHLWFCPCSGTTWERTPSLFSTCAGSLRKLSAAALGLQMCTAVGDALTVALCTL